MDIQNDRRYLQTEDPFIMDDLRQMENAPNYNKWLYHIIKPFIGRRVLEIGPGIGNISRQMINDVDLLVGIEPNKYCSFRLGELFVDKSQFTLINKSIEECRYEELKPFTLDTVLCMNVLEHIEDDAATLLFFERLLELNGRVVLFVPAVPQAYGPIDKAVGHFRRYTKSSLKEVLGKTSMQIEALFYSNFLGLLGWMYNAHISRLTQQNDTQIHLFNKLAPIISKIEGTIGCPVGQSLISVSKVKK